MTGFLVLAIGLLLAWIPEVGILGELVILVAFYFLYYDRNSLGPEHARWVARASNLILVAIAAVILIFLGSTVFLLHRTGSGVTLPMIDLAVGVVFAAFGSLSVAALLYAPTEPKNRRWLWVGVALAIATEAFGGTLTLLSTLGHAWPSASAGGVSVDAGLQLLVAVPFLLFAVLSFQARTEATRRFDRLWGPGVRR